MESRNPVFTRSQEFSRRGYATFDDTKTPSADELQGMYAAPSATATQMGRMTIDDVIMRTAAMFAVLLATAAPTYFIWRPTAPLPVLGAALIGFVLAMVISFSRTIRPPLMLAYAAVEGVFIGGISYVFEQAYPGIVAQAVLGTLAAFAAMLVLYRTGVLKATPKFRRILMIAIVGYLVFGLVNILLAAFHVGGWVSVYSTGGLLPVAISAFGVVLASLFLVLDFDFIDQGVRNGLPARFAWMAAFGLVVTLVWLYLEILRLLAILRGNN